jgi:hypothetical protein
MVAEGEATPELISKVTKLAVTGPPVCPKESVNVVEPVLLNTVSCWVLVMELPLAKLYVGKGDGKTWIDELPLELTFIVTGTDTGLFVAPGAVIVRVPL